MSIRRIKRLKVLVWPHGLTHHEMANELHRIAKLVEDGFIAGEVISEAISWRMVITEEEDPVEDKPKAEPADVSALRRRYEHVLRQFRIALRDGDANAAERYGLEAADIEKLHPEFLA